MQSYSLLLCKEGLKKLERYEASRDAMSDKHLREKAAQSDTKMRPTPISELNSETYYKCVREEIVVDIIFKTKSQSSKSWLGLIEIRVY